MSQWSAPKNAVDQTGDGEAATLPDAVLLGDCLFALLTNSGDNATTCADNINGSWSLIGNSRTGGTDDRGAWLYCFLGSAAAEAGTLVVTASGGDGATNILTWSHTPPAGTTGASLGPPAATGGSGTSIDAGELDTAQLALLVAGMRMRPNSGPTISAGSGFTSVPGTGSSYLHAEYQLDATAGTYHGTFSSDESLDGWTAMVGAIYATVPSTPIIEDATETMKIQQSTTAYPLVFKMVETSDHLTGATGLTVTATLSKNGGAFGAAAGSVTEIANGYYKVAGNATDNNTLGKLVLHTTATGADPKDTEFEVVAEDLTTAKIAAVGTVDTATEVTDAVTITGDLSSTMKASVTTAATAATPVAASVTGAVGSVTATVNADMKKINGHVVSGSGTTLDPFVPA